MKKTLLCLSLLILSPGVLFPMTGSAKPETKAERETNTPPDLVDQIDTTDVFAVPFDASEQEEEVTSKKLEQMQKKTPNPSKL